MPTDEFEGPHPAMAEVTTSYIVINDDIYEVDADRLTAFITNETAQWAAQHGRRLLGDEKEEVLRELDHEREA